MYTTHPTIQHGHFLDVARCSCCARGFLESDNWERCANMSYDGEYKGPRMPTSDDGLFPGEPIHHAECTCRDCVPGVALLGGLAFGLWLAGVCAKARG